MKIFAGKLAHDFRNALVPQFGYVTLIKEQAGDDSAVAPFALKLETAARKLESHLDAILLAVRPERRFSPKSCDFSGLLARGIEAWSKGLSEDACIRVETNLADCALVADEAQWTAVIEQLLRNARFALAAGGTLQVALQPRSLDRDQAAALSLEATDVIRFQVRDTGVGMAEDVLRRACEPFFTTHAKGQAAGLGLTMAHSVTRLHGGQLVLETVPHHGTAVTVWLPAHGAVSDETRSSQFRTAIKTERPANLPKVLLVAPDPMLREVILSFLREIPAEVISAQDNREGLKLFQRHGAEWGAVVLDAGLPAIDGIEIWSKIRELNPGVPLILISSRSDAALDARIAQLKAPPAIVMKKPFAPQRLSETVARLILPNS
ncbi:MAG: response regulator [Verrucomicrobia bacterium]|nr:response regulator [Verrucomicrobiota bacterium]